MQHILHLPTIIIIFSYKMSITKKMERFLRKKYCDNDNFFITMLTRVENIDYPTNDEISKKQVTTFCKKNKCQQIMDNVPVQEYMKLGIFLKGLKKKTLSYLINVLSEVCKEEDASETQSAVAGGTRVLHLRA